MGKAPDWYILIRAARYLQVPPWELMKRPPAWIHWATMSESAETKSQKTLQDREIRKTRAMQAARG